APGHAVARPGEIAAGAGEAGLGIEHRAHVAVDLAHEERAVPVDEVRGVRRPERVQQHGERIAPEGVDVAREAFIEDGGGDAAGPLEARQAPGERLDHPLALPEAAERGRAHRQIARPELLEVARRAGEELPGPAGGDDAPADRLDVAPMAPPT